MIHINKKLQGISYEKKTLYVLNKNPVNKKKKKKKNLQERIIYIEVYIQKKIIYLILKWIKI